MDKTFLHHYDALKQKLIYSQDTENITESNYPHNDFQHWIFIHLLLSFVSAW